MGDIRYDAAYERVAGAHDRPAEIRRLDTVEVLQALAGASRRNDPYLADILATEALNRYRRLAALFAAVTWGAGIVVVARTVLAAGTALHPDDVEDSAYLLLSGAILAVGAVTSVVMYERCRRAVRRMRRAKDR